MVQRVTTLPALPRRATDSHKGSFGSVLIIAGSPGMSGAAVLSGLGALRGGAGLVTVAAPHSVIPTIAAAEPSYLTLPLPDDSDGRLKSSAWDELEPRLTRYSAIAIGPGLGLNNKSIKLVKLTYEACKAPLVVDADALNALAELADAWPEPAGPRILTPHPGEFARLSGVSTEQQRDRRETVAVEFATQRRVTLLLKGANTVITDGRQLAVNTTGNPGMSTGGVGDVLTGLITALLAQKMAPFAAAQLGAFLHGRAGDLAADEWSQPGLIASDVVRALGAAWKSLRSQ